MIELLAQVYSPVWLLLAQTVEMSLGQSYLCLRSTSNMRGIDATRLVYELGKVSGTNIQNWVENCHEDKW